MSIEKIWKFYQESGSTEPPIHLAENGEDYCYLAILFYAQGDYCRAGKAAQESVVRSPHRVLFKEIAKAINRVKQDGKQNVYSCSAGFGRFIRGGGNVPLYEAVSRALHQCYSQYNSIRLLDIGTGDGRALLTAWHSAIRELTVVEPSTPLLKALESALIEKNVAYQAYCGRLQEFVLEHDGKWDLAQATFSFQSIPLQERIELFRWLKNHSERFLLVEFNVEPAPYGLDPQRVWANLERFERGIAEYPNDETVIQGFLMPVLLGFFDQSSARTNYEQPVQMWMEQLVAAGFKQIKSYKLYPYWWADAYLIDAA